MKTQDTSKSQGWVPTREEVVAFLHDYPLGVLSTLSGDGRPQAATIAFSETDDLELIIGTDTNSRKAANIRRNGAVAFTVTDSDKRFTVQYEGDAVELSDEEFEHYAERHYEKLPASAPFRHIKGQVHFLITPRFVRFSDCSSWPWALTVIRDETK